jgi:hypothetical protein
MVWRYKTYKKDFSTDYWPNETEDTIMLYNTVMKKNTEGAFFNKLLESGAYERYGATLVRK